MSDNLKKLKVTLFFKNNQSISFDCKDFLVYRNHKSNSLKDIEVIEPDENYPVYLDLDELSAIVVKKIIPATGFSNSKLGF